MTFTLIGNSSKVAFFQWFAHSSIAKSNNFLSFKASSSLERPDCFAGGLFSSGKHDDRITPERALLSGDQTCSIGSYAEYLAAYVRIDSRSSFK